MTRSLSATDIARGEGWTLGTTPDDHYGIYVDGVLWLIIVSETGEAEEELRRAKRVLEMLREAE